MQRVPVISPSGQPLMPTKPSRARRWLKEKKAQIYSNDLNIFAIQLVLEPSGHKTQDVVVGINPGKSFGGIGVQSLKATLLKLHLVFPFLNVTKKMTARRLLRRARRGRRINRKIPYKQRCHRAKRFNNRKARFLAPSIKANRQLELRVIKEITKLFPISNIVYGYTKAKGNKDFSPVMIGQKIMLEWLSQIALTTTQFGQQTASLRKHLKLPKIKGAKSNPCEETHSSNDGVAIACSYFAQQGIALIVTSAPFKVIAKPKIYRRQLHFENPDSHKPNPKQYRKRKGGTVALLGLRFGDFVQAEKAEIVYRGWIGGYTETAKRTNISIYDYNWKRIAQFSARKVKLLKRSTRLCAA